MKKGILLAGILFAASITLPASAQGFAGKVAAESEEARKPSCQEFPFGQGCMALGVGLAFGSVDAKPIYGLGAGFSYFLIDRLAAELNGGALFSSSVNNYYIGPALTYYIGPFAGFLFNVSVGANRQFLTGEISGQGWSYGPSVGLMTNLVGRIYWGISVRYLTVDVAGYKSSDWSWSPVVFIPF